MALASVTAENQALTGLDGGAVNLLANVSLHSASPSTTGANEFTGGGYARQACSWNASSGGSKTNSSSLAWTTAGSTAASHFGTWSSTPTYGIGGALSSSVTATNITAAPGALSIAAS